MTFASLTRIMPPPVNPVETGGSWLDVEDALGSKLPDNFKEFIRFYGSGKINHFLSVLNPFSTRSALNLLEQSKKQLEALRELHDDFGEQNPFELYPTRGGLLPVGVTDNGDIVHWLTRGNASEWTVVVNEARSPDYQQFEYDLTTFLERVLNESVKCRAFPDSAFSGIAEFHSV